MQKNNILLRNKMQEYSSSDKKEDCLGPIFHNKEEIKENILNNKTG